MHENEVDLIDMRSLTDLVEDVPQENENPVMLDSIAGGVQVMLRGYSGQLPRHVWPHVSLL